MVEVCRAWLWQPGVRFEATSVALATICNRFLTQVASRPQGGVSLQPKGQYDGRYPVSKNRREGIMFGSIGGTELLIILVIALVVFGPKRLPELGRTIGKGLSEFRRALERPETLA